MYERVILKNKGLLPPGFLFMNILFRTIGFIDNKPNCYVYGIDSHVATKDKPTLIFKNGDEYHFKGRGKSAVFHYEQYSLVPIGDHVKKPMSLEDLESELIQALKRYGFEDVIIVKQK